MDVLPPSLVITFSFLLALVLFSLMYLTIVGIAVTRVFPEKYPASRPINHKCWSMESAILGRWNFKHILRICGDSDALHFSLPFPFSFVLKPFSIPWNEILGQKGTSLAGEYVELHCDKAPDIPIYIKRSLADELIRASGDAWQYYKDDDCY